MTPSCLVNIGMPCLSGNSPVMLFDMIIWLFYCVYIKFMIKWLYNYKSSTKCKSTEIINKNDDAL